MQASNLVRRAASIGCVFLATGAIAQVPALTMLAPSPPPAGVVSTLVAPAPAAPALASAPVSGEGTTLKRLEDLQREAAIRELEQKVTGSVPQLPVVSSVPVPPAAAGQLGMVPGNPSMPAAAPGACDDDACNRPPYSLVSVISFNNEAFAEVVDTRGLVIHVEVGDKLGEWTVSKIGAGGVSMERLVSEVTIVHKKEVRKQKFVERQLTPKYAAKGSRPVEAAPAEQPLAQLLPPADSTVPLR